MRESCTVMTYFDLTV